MKRIGMLNRALVALALLMCSPAAQACSVCFGKTNDRLQVGMNFGIMTLLICIGAMLMGISGFFVYIAARSRQFKGKIAARSLNSRSI